MNDNFYLVTLLLIIIKKKMWIKINIIYQEKKLYL